MEQSVVTHRRNVHPVSASEENDSPHLRHRRDDRVRFARGGPVYATDGLVGQLRNVVVDEAAGQVVELVITLRDNQSVVVPIDVVDHTAGNALFLSEARAPFGARVAEASKYERNRFSRVNLKRLLGAAARTEESDPRAVVATAGDDFVETPGVAAVTPAAGASPAK